MMTAFASLLFHGGNPQTMFHILRNPHICTRLQVRSVDSGETFATGEAIL
jgi:hypothetical protein